MRIALDLLALLSPYGIDVGAPQLSRRACAIEQCQKLFISLAPDILGEESEDFEAGGFQHRAHVIRRVFAAVAVGGIFAIVETVDVGASDRERQLAAVAVSDVRGVTDAT